jgi:allantoate deiminase
LNDVEVTTANHSRIPRQSAERVLRRCDELAACSDSTLGLTRLFLSPAMGEAHELVAGWMREARMTPRVDELGNLIGHYPVGETAIVSGLSSQVTELSPQVDGLSPEVSGFLPKVAGLSPEVAALSEKGAVFLLGSHLDTVPNAGKYDGALGVLLAIEVVSLLEGQRLPFAIEVIGFSEEEGVRFKTPYLGSRALAGTFDPALLELRDDQGLSMRQVLRGFGLVPEDWPRARHQSEDIRGYLEAHIEQGPVLESLGAPLGIVTDIVGQSRLRVRFAGQAGHAGTLPMNGRRDALAAASEWVLLVENLAGQTPGLVATVGALDVHPNTPNVVAGEVVCSLDVRHADDETREKAVERLLEAARGIAARRGMEVEVVARASQNAVPMNPQLREHLREACDELGVFAPEIASGAGHDAAIMATLCPCAMLFLRTPIGASHCPEEDVLAEDVARALGAMSEFLRALACEGETP